MNNWFNNLVILNGYPLAIVVAVSLHVMLLAALLYLQGGNRVAAMELVQPTVVKALFIDENPQVRNERVLERQRSERQEAERRAAEEAAARREREEAERRAAEEAARREREQAAAEAEAEVRRQAALREREELERQQRLETERRQQELREAETERQREVAAAERRRLEEAERARQRAEAEAAAAAEASRNEFELVQSATGLIQQFIQESWRIPPSARNGMRAVLEIQMLPTGEVTSVRVTRSSGDPAFDREAENAVYRAQPFSELSEIPTQIFNRNFRTFSLAFEPDSLLN